MVVEALAELAVGADALVTDPRLDKAPHPARFRVIESKIHIHDLHATMLQLLGIDHTCLTFNQVGRDFRLTGVHGSAIKEILA